MSTIQQLLEQKTAQALAAASGLQAPAIVNPAANPKFGDYQANGVMSVAKTQKKNPLWGSKLQKFDPQQRLLRRQNRIYPTPGELHITGIPPPPTIW